MFEKNDAKRNIEGVEMEQIYYTVRDVAKRTGLSESMIRKGLKNGEIPHIMSGNRALINVNLLMKIFEDQCLRNLKKSN